MDWRTPALGRGTHAKDRVLRCDRLELAERCPPVDGEVCACAACHLDVSPQDRRALAGLDFLEENRLAPSVSQYRPAAGGPHVGDPVGAFTEHRDEMTPEGFLSNNAGGILGGISTGQDVICSIALKPTSSLRLPGRSVYIRGEAIEVVTTGRPDPCVGIRATPIAEAMVALVLMDQAFRHRAQCGDVGEIKPRIPRG